MREYRGKRKDGGGWVKGDLIQTLPYKDGHIHCWIKERDILGLGAISTPTDNFLEVTPESVGQDIGIKDRSRTKIFKGDIAKVYGGYYGDDILEIGFKNGCFGRIYKGKLLTFVSDHSENVEIIGNVFDNPELLKELEGKT